MHPNTYNANIIDGEIRSRASFSSEMDGLDEDDREEEEEEEVDGGMYIG